MSVLVESGEWSKFDSLSVGVAVTGMDMRVPGIEKGASDVASVHSFGPGWS
jgi:hypothetical protein